MTDPSARTRSRLTLIALFALFLAPVVAAIYLNSQWSDYRPEASRNYGTLIQPVVPIPPTLADALPAEGWRLLWRVDCAPDCSTQADLLARVDKALGRHAEAFTPVVLDPAAGDLPANVAVSARPDALGSWLANTLEVSSGAVLVDPLGNAMMRYPADFDASGLIDDLERLLKYSQFESGDSGAESS